MGSRCQDLRSEDEHIRTSAFMFEQKVEVLQLGRITVTRLGGRVGVVASAHPENSNFFPK